MLKFHEEKSIDKESKRKSRFSKYKHDNGLSKVSHSSSRLKSTCEKYVSIKVEQSPLTEIKENFIRIVTHQSICENKKTEFAKAPETIARYGAIEIGKVSAKDLIQIKRAMEDIAAGQIKAKRVSIKGPAAMADSCETYKTKTVMTVSLDI